MGNRGCSVIRKVSLLGWPSHRSITLNPTSPLAAGINVFSLLHTLLARQSLRNLVDSSADREMSLHLTQDGAGGRPGDQIDRSESRNRLRYTERSVSAEEWDKVEKDGEVRDHRRPRPISVSL